MNRHDHPLLSVFPQAHPTYPALSPGARRGCGAAAAARMPVLVLAAALLAAPQAFGQAQGAGAMFEGRPAMAGAQGGQGAQAGMPQGGLGVQGSEGQKGLVLRKPSGLDSMPPLPAREPGASAAGTANADMVLKPEKGLASERRSALSKDRRDARKAARRARAAASGTGGAVAPARAVASAPAKSAP